MSSHETIRGCETRGERGAAMIIALALILALTILVAATQLQTVNQLKAAKTERDYERALQMAEAGAHAYRNMLKNGVPQAGVANGALLPKPNVMSSLLSVSEFKTRAKNGTIPAGNLVYYPAGQTEQGYYAGQLNGSGTSAVIVSYGWSHGVVRRVRMDTDVTNIFDWSALWGMNPDNAWNIGGGATLVGAVGGEGVMSYGNNNTFYDGPIVMCTNAARFADANGQNITPLANGQFAQSQPNIPSGHVGVGEVAAPSLKRYNRPLGFPTADQGANEWVLEKWGITTNAGVNYFKTNHNDDATGIRYLIQNDDGTFYELDSKLPGYAPPVTAANDYLLNFTNASKSADSILKKNSLSGKFYGIRVYPGNYSLTGIQMGSTDQLMLRTYSDTDGADPAFAAQVAIPALAPLPNPNVGIDGASERDIRFWIGHAKAGADPQTQFRKGTTMEWPKYASRFRVYNASRGGVDVRGPASGPPFEFNVAILNYNRDAKGYYGNINFTSGVYLRGSLLAWHVDVSGGTTLERQMPELAPKNVFSEVTNWSELP